MFNNVNEITEAKATTMKMILQIFIKYYILYLYLLEIQHIFSFFFNIHLQFILQFNRVINKTSIKNLLLASIRSILDLHKIFITKIENMFIACATAIPYYHLWSGFVLFYFFFCGRQTIKFHLNKMETGEQQH